MKWYALNCRKSPIGEPPIGEPPTNRILHYLYKYFISNNNLTWNPLNKEYVHHQKNCMQLKCYFLKPFYFYCIQLFLMPSLLVSNILIVRYFSYCFKAINKLISREKLAFYQCLRFGSIRSADIELLWYWVSLIWTLRYFKRTLRYFKLCTLSL